MLSVSQPKTDLFKKPLSVWNLIEILLDPVLAFGIFYGLLLCFDKPFDAPCFLFSLIVFLITFPGRSLIRDSFFSLCQTILFDWALLGLILIFFMKMTDLLQSFPDAMLYAWLISVPIVLIVSHYLIQRLYRRHYRNPAYRRRAVIVGKNDIGLSLANAVVNDPLSDKALIAFFDDRSDPGRVPETPDFLARDLIKTYPNQLLAEYVNRRQIDLIYLCLPMFAQPRITQMLADLQDTTASIYFVPDIFVTDLIQARVDRVAALPVVAVRETPFYGANSMIKRLFDVVFSATALLMLSPILLLLALAVKITSRGSVIFRQRRYGLDGREIIVYKFRSMRVMEDGQEVRQAAQNDRRLTPIGGFLRRTSLDELPQFYNVLRGEMSVVGPRPHAVSHNETYRKLISGYMVRHKVKPGITGLAQVSGFRGETETLEKMEKRVQYDLEYLRTWSLGLDISIIIKTVLLAIKGDDKAY